MSRDEPDSKFGNYSGGAKPKQPPVEKVKRVVQPTEKPAPQSSQTMHDDTQHVAVQPRSRLLLVLGGAIVAMGISIVAFRFLGAQPTMHQAIPTLLVAACIGLVVRWLGRGEQPAYAVIAVVCTIIGCLAGIAWADYHRWEPPMLDMTLKRMFLSEALLFYAVAAYLAYILSGTRRS